ncbi:MAG: hypothetical protein KF774_09440 [Planctomyces sp.]|nr:hypothetical protein [Planctomyces sp.]
MRTGSVLLCLFLASSAAPLLTGCGGSSGNEVLNYNEEESKKKGAEYEAQMRQAMKAQGRKVPEAKK